MVEHPNFCISGCPTPTARKKPSDRARRRLVRGIASADSGVDAWGEARAIQPSDRSQVSGSENGGGLATASAFARVPGSDQSDTEHSDQIWNSRCLVFSANAGSPPATATT